MNRHSRKHERFGSQSTCQTWWKIFFPPACVHHWSCAKARTIPWRKSECAKSRDFSYFPNRRERWEKSRIARKKSIFRNAGQYVSVNQISEYAACQSKNPERRCSPEVRITKSGSGRPLVRSEERRVGKEERERKAGSRGEER